MDEKEKIYAVDWSHLEENLAVYDGKKFLKKLPKPAQNVTIYTENMPKVMAAPYIEAGAKILRCSPNASADLRKEQQKKDPTWEKTHENDCKLIWLLGKHRPNCFRPMKLDPPLVSYYNIFKDFQEVRMRTNNRLFSDKDNQDLATFFEGITKTEEILKKSLGKELEKHFMFPWMNKIKGLGPAMAGALAALLDDCSRFDTISKLWAYGGYKVEDGKVQKHTPGQVSNWNGKIRTLMYNVVDMFIKHRTPVYREIYDEDKQRQLAKGIPLGHAHKRAIRKTAKIFLQHYWVVARTLKGLPVSQPWVIAHGGHVDYIKPPFFIDAVV